MTLKGDINPATIKETIDTVLAFSEKNGLPQKSRVQLSVALEEMLLDYMESSGVERGGKELSFSLSLRLQNGNILVRLRVGGAAFNPLDAASPILRTVIDGMDSAPVWAFRHGYNQINLVFQVYSTMLKNLQFSWKYMRGQRLYFFIAVISQLISVAFSIVTPVLSAKIIVSYTESVFNQIVLVALAIFAVRLLSNVVLFIANRSYNIVYNQTLSNLEEDLIDNALHITKGCIDENGTGLFIQRLTVDTTKLATGFNTLADMSTTLFNYLGILGAVFFISPSVFIVVFILIVMQGAFEQLRSIKVNVLDRRYREANERFTGFISEMVKGATDVKTLNSAEAFKAELALRIRDANDKRMYMQSRSWVYRLTRMELGVLTHLGFMILLGYLIMRGRLSAVTAIVLFNYYSQLDNAAIAALSSFLEFVRDFNLSTERVHELLQGHKFPKERFGSRHIESLQGDIQLESVSFSYKKSDPQYRPKDVLKDLSLHIPAGSTAALVGLSGSGKSTIIRLISKLYEAGRGRVLLDGIHIRELDKDTIRKNIALVDQKPYIFNLSIKENLLLVKPDMSEEEMIAVCKKACIHDDIMSMTDGYDTVVGEGGITMSGGQCQRLAIARALLRNFKILLLDEATSALDNITQSRIQSVLENIHGKQTIVVVAHRLSTVIHADVIFFIDDGKVLDRGTHQELLARCQKYRALYEGEA